MINLIIHEFLMNFIQVKWTFKSINQLKMIRNDVVKD